MMLVEYITLGLRPATVSETCAGLTWRLRYLPQTNRSKSNKSEVSPICPLCKLAPEDLRHFLLECPGLHHVRGVYLGELEQVLMRAVPDCAAQFLADSETLCRIVMDCRVLGRLAGMEPQVGLYSELERLSRNFCFAMHLKRTSLLTK